MYNSKLFLLSFLFLSSSSCLAETSNLPHHPFYVGAIAGFGSTTWQGLVPSEKNQNVALMLSTPIDVEEGGSAWGVLAGYEFTRFFAIEANYMHFPEANVHFDSISLFSFDHDGLEVLTTKTEVVSLLGKLMVPIPHSHMKIFSGAGVAGVHRKDIVVDDWRPGPTFTVGVNYNFTEHITGEVAGNFTAGYGESQLSPADSYYPFLYSVAAHLIFRF
ncbi:outer membrane beta-barrel protein [Fluoribacter dumoffii]|uniref:OmpA-like transmembrane domain n=1 Tax=Fluoribacter dumoffii TaxID=463 RepID=A0A377GAV8_9GAMM|nr:outer membrane beta-barrel protein [Fluoribacter dumoffii]KTC88763.1 OmpA-like transmembrane domain protein [Fluoribacter dumoffii NY 23]MCW8385942.1 outer membrane beta-barrel protein [Fluoribacter dumoffii]MCW8418995.1 outer membrane beta-barrel protein [Fluoribacter dumoffii]MCW8453161.1 outer membrane beta-barrel protein [Fluoribacter dumoffii]MCW8459621.1 outer membrane beta-barrel protein [Fluoribacter dumoffii]